MDTSAFTISFTHSHRSVTAEIRPCCREDNIVDYAVWMDNKLAFTITREVDNTDHWVVALKNADDDLDNEMIQLIGAAINDREKKT